MLLKEGEAYLRKNHSDRITVHTKRRFFGKIQRPTRNHDILMQKTISIISVVEKWNRR
jgi:hypothetical protein